MAEYIERGALLDRIGSVPPWCGYFEPYTFEQWQGINTTHEAIKKIIKELPTADVQEVRYGEWIYISRSPEWADCECSECGYKDSFANDNECFYNYCPECGAKMDKE